MAFIPPATVTTGDIQLGAVEIKNGTDDTRLDIETAGADAKSNTANMMATLSRLMGFNGTTWDRLRTAVVTVSATLTGFLNTLPWGVYNATPSTRTEGQGGPVQTDNTGGTIVNPKALNKTDDALLAHDAPSDSKIGITASGQVLAGPGVLYGFTIVSHTAGATIRFSDALTATTPYVSAAMTTVAGHLAGDTIYVGGIHGLKMATGCYCTISGTIELIPLAKLD